MARTTSYLLSIATIVFLGVSLATGSASLAGPLHDAAKLGDLAAIAAELDAGAGIEDEDKGVTPLFLAAREGHLDAVQLLLKRGADPNHAAKLGLPITVAVLRGHADIIATLIASGADAKAAVKGETMLHFAVANDCLECVKVLIGAGADANAVWLSGADLPGIITPLHLALHDGHAEIADFLLAHGATVMKPDPISAKLHQGDAMRGEAFFAKLCARCHASRPRDPVVIAPNLWNVVGRAKASTDFPNYSKTLMAWGGVWTYEDLNILLAAPTLTKPGVNMEIEAAPNEADRLDVIAYLRTLSDTPVPLP